ncbi:hypothetical protein [Pedobacter sp. KACC 23697]|uniref:DUF4488 domain-containing protein n=1 Tax=Pedobacter sp. KACC 23697 TaxID=3149230 RepID=A0AAU7K3C4_9SPHI
MRKVFRYFLLVALFSLSSNCIIAQEKATLSDFVGAWEFVTPPRQADAPPMPFLSTLKVFDAMGNCLQLKVTEQGTVIWQTAKIEVESEDTLKESVNYSVSQPLNNAIFKLKYKIFDGPDGTRYLGIKGGAKQVDGKETYEWQELWRKVDKIKKAE